MRVLPVAISRLFCVFPGIVLFFAVLDVSMGATIAADRPALIAEARQHFQKGRYAEAIELYDELEQGESDGPLIAVGKSRCLEAQGEWKLAAEVLEAASSTHPNDALLLARIAEVHLARGEYELCEKAVERALAIDAELPAARIVQADLWTATGMLKQADDGYRWFVRYYNKAQPTDADTLMLVARGSAQYARWHSVSQVFDFVVNTLCPDALKDDPDCWQADFMSGMLLLEKFNRPQALPDLRKALTINPRASDVHAALAQAALQDHSLADAEQFASRALEINPVHIPALLVRADLRLDDGDLKGATECVDQALSVNPHDERALARRATIFLIEDGPPSDADLDELFGNLDNISDAKLSQSTRFSSLVSELTQQNRHPGVFLGALGQKLEARKKYDLAEKCYRQAVASMPQLSAPRTDLGMLYMRIGRNADASKILDKAFDADPYHVRVSNMRKVLKLLDGYETITTDHFVIRVDGQADRILGRYMAEFLEEQYPILVEKFGFEPPARTQFEIFNKAKGLSAHQWFSARMIGLPWVQTIGASTGMIVALASPTATEKPFNWARVVRHEFVHIVTLQQTRFNIPHWYTEALAVGSEGYPRPEEWNQLLLARSAAGTLMNLDNINLGFIRPKTPDDWTLAYCQSQLYSQYLADRFGPDANARLLNAFRENLTTEAAIEKVCQVDKADFEKGYQEYLKKIISQLKQSQREVPMTLDEAEKAHLADPESASLAARYALELLKANRRKEARKLAEIAIDKNRAEPLAAVVLAQLELRSEDYGGAAKWLDAALDRDRPHPRVLESLADVRMRQEKPAEAAELYRLGLKHEPERVAWLKGLASALLRTGETRRLKEVLKKITTIDGEDATVRQKLTRMALDEKKYDEAIRYGRMALEIDVVDVDTHRMLAQAYAFTGQPEKSVAEWATAAELKPDDLDLVLSLAQAEAAAGRKEAAIRRLDELITKHSEFAPARKLRKTLE